MVPSLSSFLFFFLILPPPPRSTLFPYTTLFRSLTAAQLTDLDQLGNNSGKFDLGDFLAWVQARKSPRSNLRSEEHTSELQSHSDLVCRLLLEKKKKKQKTTQTPTEYDGRGRSQR